MKGFDGLTVGADRGKFLDHTFEDSQLVSHLTGIGAIKRASEVGIVEFARK